MAAFEDTLYTTLTGHAGLSALVSDRVYPLLADGEGGPVERPYIVFQRISGTNNMRLSGRDTRTNILIQVDVWSDKYPTAKTSFLQVLLAMDSLVIGSTSSRQTLETELYRISTDFSVWFDES